MTALDIAVALAVTACFTTFGLILYITERRCRPPKTEKPAATETIPSHLQSA